MVPREMPGMSLLLGEVPKPSAGMFWGLIRAAHLQ